MITELTYRYPENFQAMRKEQDKQDTAQGIKKYQPTAVQF
jgi:hypothetical protein